MRLLSACTDTNPLTLRGVFPNDEACPSGRRAISDLDRKRDCFAKEARNDYDTGFFSDVPAPGKYDAIYLCSALVLPGQRRKGLARQLTTDAIRAISRDRPVKQLFSWAFSKEGEALAADVAIECGLPLYRRPE